MPGRFAPEIEPFAERIVGAQAANTYRFGYRIERTKDVVTAVILPAETVELALTARFSLSARMSPTGDISPALTDPANISIAPSAVWGVESLEQLVADAINAKNLRLEEAGATELRILLARLERSVMLVTMALAEEQK